MATQVHPVDVTDANFEEIVLQAGVPAVVDLWAPWCGPCRQMAPVFEQLAGEYAGRAMFAKLNVDESIQVPGSLGVQSIPTMVVFKDGQEVARIVGANSVRERLSAALDSAL